MAMSEAEAEALRLYEEEETAVKATFFAEHGSYCATCGEEMYLRKFSAEHDTFTGKQQFAWWMTCRNSDLIEIGPVVHNYIASEW